MELLRENGVGKLRQNKLSELYYDIQRMLGYKGRIVTGGRLFHDAMIMGNGIDVDYFESYNNRLYGLEFYVGNDRFVVIDQPGFVELHKYNCGYVELRSEINGEVEIEISEVHNSKYFGDVDLTDKEREEGYSQVIEVLVHVIYQR